MATVYTHRDTNIRKTWGLMTLFLVFIIGLGWVFAQVLGNPSLLYVAVVISLVMNVVSYWYSDKIVLSISGASPATREGHFELFTIVENLAITAGLPMPKVYVINDPAPNAFATGRNPENAAVAVTTGLLSVLDRIELEGVLAHEMSHVGNRDILVSTIVVVLVGFVALLSDFFLRSAHHMGGNNKDNRVGLFLIIAGVVLALLSPLIANLIKLAISRKREFLADASGALLTRYPEGLASALLKIEQHARPMERANHATAHLFIANPFAGEGTGAFLTKLFMTHPPTAERVKALRS